MNKKIMLLALAAVSALFALPGVASATPAHLSAAENFTVAGGAGTLTRTDGNTVSCTAVSGSGSLESTTTGSVSLTFTGCKNNLGFNCTSGADVAGTITAPNLPVHLITLPESGGMPKAAGVLITPPTGASQPTAGKPLFAEFTCFGVPVKVFGNGIIGTSECGKTGTSFPLNFASSSTGHQTDQLYTGTTYSLESKIGTNGAHETSSIDASATINFAASKTLTCT